MKNLLWVAAVLGLLAAIGPSGAEEKKSDDAKAIAGTWTVEKFEASDGGGPSEDELKKTRITFADGTMTIDMGEMKHTGKYKLMAGKTPRQIDVVPQDGPDSGKTFAGIYEVSGDTLKLCLAHSETRPTEFAAKGDKVILIALKREKK